MATKAGMNDTKADSGPSAKRQGKPMTTLEKVKAANAKKDAAMNVKKKRPAYTPFWNTSAAVATKESRIRKPKKPARPKKPMTTKEKIKVLVAQKDSMRFESPDTEIEKAQVKSKAKKPKRASIFDAIGNHDPSVLRFGSKPSGPSVLVRPTERTKRMQAQRGGTLQRTINKATTSMQASQGNGKLKLTDVPEDVLFQIWKLCVVYPQFFVWPDAPTGKEQPDLAMVSRAVRNDVLPVYYEKNIFAVDVSPPRPIDLFSRQSDGATLPIHAIRKWSRRLEEKGWFANIRRWAFSYTPHAPSLFSENDGSFVVFVRFMELGCKQSGNSWSACVEVHREARCLLPGAEEFGKCVIPHTLAFLNKVVIDICNEAEGGFITGDMIVKLAETIQQEAYKLAHLRCHKDEVRDSIEVGSVPDAL